ncbi:MAG: histidine kinase dimerization/phospho-acceptor domain-containing protein, partial [bacterium]
MAEFNTAMNDTHSILSTSGKEPPGSDEKRIGVENELRKLNSALLRQTALLEAAHEELKAFSYSVSHDLRAPLRSITGFSLALLEDYAGQLDAQGKDYLTRIHNAAGRMSQLIDDLAKLSRLTRSELRMEPVDLSALARL